MKTNPTRYSSAVGDVWVMATFKAKYCHKIFDIRAVRELCEALLIEAFQLYGIRHRKIAFDADHVHMIVDLGLYSKPEFAKKMRGFTAKQLFRLMPWLKAKFFWGSGLWNPAYDVRGISDMGIYERYLDKQKYASKGQKTLLSF
ncbi:MAG TPA: transposase [Candidatus Nanoarchaeia archaeon]|nr:transposase [Candidatus Nanoarchaeia archaeon]